MFLGRCALARARGIAADVVLFGKAAGLEVAQSRELRFEFRVEVEGSRAENRSTMTSPTPWQAWLAGQGGTLADRHGSAVVAGFGDPEGEALAVRRAAGIGCVEERSVFAIEGRDRAKFLHGQCTQEVKARLPGAAADAFVLEPKGRVVSDLRFLVQEERLLASASRERVSDLLRWLDRFILSSDVRILDLADTWLVLVIAGPGSEAVLAAAGVPAPLPAEGSWVKASIAGVSVPVAGDRGLGATGAEIWTPRADAPAVLGALLAAGAPLGLRLVGADARDALRIEAGRPVFGRDLDESVLPAESGSFERTVSLTKGCYSGQEVVARQHFLGRPRRRLCGLLLEGPGAHPGDRVLRDGAPWGTVTSAVRSPTLGRWIALALLKGDEQPPGTMCAVAGGEGRAEIAARVAALPFV